MKILLVEDDEGIARIIVRVLSSEGHNVSWEADGEAGLLSASSGGYDCLVLDWMLPRLSGIEICRALRSRRLSVPVLMLTARSEVDNKVAGLDAGADDYLTKPFEIEELSARVRALARRQAVNKGGTIILGRLRIDMNSLSVAIDAEELVLTKQEFLLLEALARYEGRTLTREFILSSIWNAEETQTNSVDVHVSSLRRKLKEGRDLPTIKTVHREGYRLIFEEGNA